MQNATQLLKARLGLLMAGVASTALIAALPLAAVAQDSTAAPAAKSDDSTVVIVTAQKREQRLQDVPIVVTTLSAKLLQDAGVHDIKDMQILTPGLTVTSTENEALTTARIRGVGTVGDNPGLESSVGVVIDGVYRPRNGVGFEDLGELDRIEVLKGPQGTLFGKNTSAGVINVLTKKPSFTPGFDGEATFGNFGERGYAASITGPIGSGDKVAGRLYAAHREHDGFTNVDTGVGPRTKSDDQDQNVDTVRGQLLFTPNDNVDVRVIGDYTKRDENCCVAVQTQTGPTGAALNLLAGGHGVASTADPDARIAYSNRDTHQVIRDSGLSVEANIKLPDFFNSTLTSVTAGRDWKSTSGQDLDYSGADVLYRPDNGDYSTRFKTFSEELRLAGATDHVNWLVGGFYAKEDLALNDTYIYGASYEPFLGLLISGALPAPYTSQDPNFVAKLTSAHGSGLDVDGAQHYVAGQGARDHYTQSDTSYALFTNESWKITDQWEATLGLRYTSEKKSMTAAYSNSDGGAACLAGLTQYQTAATQIAHSVAPTNPYWGAVIAYDAAHHTNEAQTLIGALCPFWANPYFSNPLLGGNRTAADSHNDSDFSGTVKLAYHITDDAMLYGSYARGYKAGGYNLDRAQTGVTPDSSLWFPAETADSFELGLKTSLMDKALMFNITAFDQKYKNFQLNTFSGVAFIVESIPDLTSKGVDADVYWRTPVPGLSFQGGISYADTKYGQFTAADLLNSSHFATLSNLPGQQMSFAPKWSDTAALTWTHGVGNMRLSANVSAKYTSDYNTGSDLDPNKEQKAFTLVNARLGIGPQDKRWTAEIWAQNLTNVAYRQVVINAPLQGTDPSTNTYDAFMGQPRTYGVTLRLHY